MANAEQDGSPPSICHDPSVPRAGPCFSRYINPMVHGSPPVGGTDTPSPLSAHF